MQTRGALVALGLGAILASCTLFVDTSDLANRPARTPDERDNDNDNVASLAPSAEASTDSSPIRVPEAGTRSDASTDASSTKDAADPTPSCKPNGTKCDDNDECCSDGCKSHTCSD